MSTEDQFREVRRQLSRRNVVIAPANGDGDYRVNIKGGNEATAYYTEDLMEALRRGMQMAEERDTTWRS